MNVRLILPLAVATLFAINPSTRAVAQADTTLKRSTFGDLQFRPLFPGAEIHLVYGGIGTGKPTAQMSRLQAGVTIPKHFHSEDYFGVVIAGNYQHWEENDADQGPVLSSGSTYYQAGSIPHYDACLGPDDCIVYVYFPVAADNHMAQPLAVE